MTPYFSCPFVTVGFLPGLAVQKKTRAGNFNSLLFFPACNLQILMFPGITWIPVKGFTPRRLCRSLLQLTCRSPFCADRCPGAVQAFLRCSPVQGQHTACTAATDVGEGRRIKLFTRNCCERIRELCWPPICTVWHVVSTSSARSLHGACSYAHEQTQDIFITEKVSYIPKQKPDVQNYSDIFWIASVAFQKKDEEGIICFLPPYHISIQKSLSATFIKPGFCGPWAALPKHSVRAAEL